MLVPEGVRSFIRCKVLRPMLRMLRGGVSPKRLAWSIAVGLVVGINPVIGMTTVTVILIAWLFRLNHVGSQTATHLVAPLQWLLFLPFVQAGVYLFHTRKLPMSVKQIEHLSHHPLKLIRDLWQWEWHALLIWAVIAAVLCPLIAIYLRRMLVLTLRKHRTLVYRPASTVAPPIADTQG